MFIASDIASRYIPTTVYFKDRQQTFAKSFMNALLKPQWGRYNQKQFLDGLEGYAKMIETKRNKKIFRVSSGYKTIEYPQINKEYNELINKIWNYGIEPSKQSDLLPV